MQLEDIRDLKSWFRGRTSHLGDQRHRDAMKTSFTQNERPVDANSTDATNL
jgi:hypothetical protein